MPEVMRARRGAMQMSQAELATAVGIDKRQIKRYEAGESHPTLPVARAIARTLGITIDELAGDPPAPTPFSGVWHVAWHYFDEGHHISRQRVLGRQRGALLILEARDRDDVAGPGGMMWHAKMDIHSQRFLVGRILSPAVADGPSYATLVLNEVEPWGEEPSYKATWMSMDPLATPETGSGLWARHDDEVDALIRAEWREFLPNPSRP